MPIITTATKNEGAEIPNCATNPKIRSIHVPCRTAAMLPNVMPKTVAKAMLNNANTAVPGSCSRYISKTGRPFWYERPNHGSLRAMGCCPIFANTQALGWCSSANCPTGDRSLRYNKYRCQVGKSSLSACRMAARVAVSVRCPAISRAGSPKSSKTRNRTVTTPKMTGIAAKSRRSK